MGKLSALPIVPADDSDRIVPLPVAAQQGRITVSRGISLVLDGAVPIGGVDLNVVGVPRYRVSANLLVRAARRGRAPGFSVLAAAPLLGLPYNAAMDFVKRGIIATTTEGKAAYVTVEEIDRFRRTYVTAPELSEILGTKRSRDTIAILAGAGVQPACPRPPYWKVLYWRDEAVAAARDLAGIS